MTSNGNWQKQDLDFILKSKNSHINEDMLIERKKDMKPKREECAAWKNRLDKELWQELRDIIYEDAYLCYHDDDGCQFVLNKIVEALKKYEINKIEVVEDLEKMMSEKK